jgi:hypothetical protein
MKIRFVLASAIVAGVALAASAAPPAADPHQHAAAPAKLTLDHGKRWATDPPLREGMSAIRSALAPKLAAVHKGTLTAAEYRSLGATVESQVAEIVAKCKLEPAADANLHLIVADLVAGADAMQGKSPRTPAAGAQQVARALDQYGRYFDHPGWKPLA